MGFGSDYLTLNSSSRPDCGQQDAATHSVTQQCNRECNTRVENSATQLSNRWMGRSAVLRCSGSRTTYPPAAPAQHQQTNGELGNYNSAIPSLGLLSISRAWLRFGRNHIVFFKMVNILLIRILFDKQG